MIPNRTPFGLRMPESLKKQVKESAEENGRSQNSEICFQLQAAYRAEASAQK
ncbi:Arc family DNA-binding protein [Limimaricola sp. G21655-S1]|uniref:Arc family DNA-binding protein n=1 Tax=Limimaricola sp. G21655-S1 TaxID=3014768 RepID=UPI00359C5D1B